MGLLIFLCFFLSHETHFVFTSFSHSIIIEKKVNARKLSIEKQFVLIVIRFFVHC